MGDGLKGAEMIAHIVAVAVLIAHLQPGQGPQEIEGVRVSVAVGLPVENGADGRVVLVLGLVVGIDRQSTQAVVDVLRRPEGRVGGALRGDPA